MNEEEDYEKSSILEAVAGQVQQDKRPRIKFVPAKYSYTQNFSDNFTFEKINAKCEIIRGYKKGSTGGKRSSLYDTRELNSIRQWNGGFVRLSKFADKQNRGFALSVLYALSTCPVFRQHADAHKRTCHRVGCNLCKIYNFYKKSEEGETSLPFPFEIRSFNRFYKDGDRGDSAEFFSQLLDVLQIEELSGARSFGETDQYTTAIGQMFRIQATTKINCSSCGRQRSSLDSFWTLIASSQDLYKETDPHYEEHLSDCRCDACGNEMNLNIELTSMPIIFTMQLPHWTPKGEFRKKNVDMTKFLKIKINDVPYKLVSFTTYDGYTNGDGTYGAMFLSSSGTWSMFSKSLVQTISVSKLNSFQPQLLFFSRDEPNEQMESVTITRIDDGDEIEEEDFNDLRDTRKEEIAENPVQRDIQKTDAVIEGIKSSIIAQKKMEDKPDKDTRQSKKFQKEVKEPLVKEAKPKIVKNPMALLMKKSALQTGTWDGKEDETKREDTKGFVEEKPDEWDAELDKGHQRKIRHRREIPDVNPFDNVPPKRKPGDFGKRSDFNRNNDKRGGFHGNRGRGGFHGKGRGGFNGHRDKRN